MNLINELNIGNNLDEIKFVVLPKNNSEYSYA